ncbi:MAG TPA: glycosyltransferase, partial [Methanocorpusculum sp.]|nr:glycosyltransferase [Methanocorpusculum sp.]
MNNKMVFSKDDVCVLIPTLNEEKTIGSVITDLKSHGYNNIFVIDGNSSDNTRNIAQNLGASVEIQQSKGKGAAIIESISHINTKYLLMLDGDGTNPPQYADEMLKPIIDGNADHVIGNRLHEYEPGALTTLNRIGNSIMNLQFKLSSGVYMRDILSGYRAFTLDSLRKMDLKEIGFEIETEMCSKSAQLDLRFDIVDTYYKKRVGSNTKLHPIRDGYKIMRAINKYGLAYNTY